MLAGLSPASDVLSQRSRAAAGSPPRVPAALDPYVGVGEGRQRDEHLVGRQGRAGLHGAEAQPGVLGHGHRGLGRGGRVEQQRVDLTDDQGVEHLADAGGPAAARPLGALAEALLQLVQDGEVRGDDLAPQGLR